MIYCSVSAYAQLSRSLLSDLEHAILGNDFRQQISNLRDNNQSLKTEAVRIQTNMNEFLARKDQVILSLESEKEVLEFKNKSLLKAVDMLNVELEKSTRRVAEMNEKNIEICMQGIAYKNEVDVGCDKILNSIQARVGFVPSTVHKQVCNLKILKVRPL